MTDKVEKNKIYWRKYLLELLSVFIGVSLAFALNKWNEDRRDKKTETKILIEIRNGLHLDLEDIKRKDFGIK